MRESGFFKLLVLGMVSWGLFFGEVVFGDELIEDFSPDRKVKLEVKVGEVLSYSVFYEGKGVIVDSALGLELESSGELGNNMVVQRVTQKNVKNEWEPVYGNRSKMVDHCREVWIKLNESKAGGRGLGVIFRVYNEGVAFRYYLPRWAGVEDFVLTKEKTQFRFSGDHTAWVADYKGFVSHQEEEFKKVKLSDVGADWFAGVPLLVKVGDVCYAALTEANLTDWAGMYLCGVDDEEDGYVSLATKLSPLVDGSGLVRSSAPRYSPWRVIMIGKEAGDLIESEIILNLNEPCAIKDTSWIKAGMMAWDHWWSGDSKMDTETLKEYVQFAADMGFPYQLVDWNWYGWGSLKNADLDILTVDPNVNMPELLEFAKERDVKLILWLHWTHVDKDDAYKKAFALYEKWGVAGVKIDFMQRDDQEMVNWYQKIVKSASEHHLLVDFHGAYKPTGFRRTYPNLITREGVLGNEYNKWSGRVTPEHNCTLPFTRMLAGPMDYTPGGFLNRGKGKFRTNVKPTEVMGTRCHQLGMFVVYESPLCCVCDHPRNYRGQAGLDFLRVVPTTWDDTRVLKGEVGEYIVMVRRSGERWFLGAMTNWEGRSLEVCLDFLGEGKYTAHIFADASDSGENAEKLVESNQSVKAGETFMIKMASGGGLAAYFEPVTAK
jgi:alpha-glucosidase